MGKQFDWLRHQRKKEKGKAFRPLKKSDLHGTALITSTGGAGFIMTSLGIPHGVSVELLSATRISALAVFAIGVVLSEILIRYVRKNHIK